MDASSTEPTTMQRAGALLATAALLGLIAVPAAAMSWDLWVMGEVWAADAVLPNSSLGGLAAGAGALFAGLAGVGLGTLSLAVGGVSSLVAYAGMSTLMGRDPLAFLS